MVYLTTNDNILSPIDTAYSQSCVNANHFPLKKSTIGKKKVEK